MAEQVIIVGAGGHGKVVADAVRSSGHSVLGFLDGREDLPAQVCGIPVLGTPEQYGRYPHAAFLIAVGNSAAREKLVSQMPGVRWHTAVHPAAVISKLDVSIGEGTVILPGAIVNPGAAIGRHCIINSGAIVEHDNRIGDFCHIAVGACLAGNVTVGDHSWIGIGAVVSNGVTIPSHCTAGAGAVIVRDPDTPGTYVGVPAKKLEKNGR